MRCSADVLRAGALALACALAGCSAQPDAATAPVGRSAPPTAVETPPPAYPEELACNGVGGTVGLRVLIGTDGHIRDSEIQQGSGNALLDAAARSAVASWTFNPALQAGNYFAPALIDGLKNGCRTAQEEVFGPVGVLLPFRDEETLIAEANDSVYGLASGIWTGDFKRAWRIGRALNAGTVWINTYKQFSIATPFGGNAESGIGREKARDGLKAYMRQKSLYIDLSGRPIPWAD